MTIEVFDELFLGICTDSQQFKRIPLLSPELAYTEVNNFALSIELHFPEDFPCQVLRREKACLVLVFLSCLSKSAREASRPIPTQLV